MKMAPRERIFLLITGLLAAYQIAVGVDGLEVFTISAYTLAFGILLVASLLMLILGYSVLDSPVVVIVSTLIPLGLSLGLVWEHLPQFRTPYVVFTLVGFAAIIATRSFSLNKNLAMLVLAVVHGVAGLIIFLLPLIFAFNGRSQPGFALVGLGGGLIGLGGLLLSFLKAGRPILSRDTIFTILPGLLLLMTTCFVVGFQYR